jgi:hypothetical protein
MEKQMGIRDLFRCLRDFLDSTSLATNFLALFLVAFLLSLLAYTVVANPIMTTAIIGFSSGIIGAITDFYFNKDQLNAVQREQQVQGIRANEYAGELQVLENRHAALTDKYTDKYADKYNKMLELLGRASAALPPDSEI